MCSVQLDLREGVFRVSVGVESIPVLLHQYGKCLKLTLATNGMANVS